MKTDNTQGVKLKGEAKTARIPIKVVQLDERLKNPNGFASNPRLARAFEIRTSCASKSCTPSAKKPAARTSANALAAAPPPS